jgi:tetratricopeptide (TPR) repeat protein
MNSCRICQVTEAGNESENTQLANQTVMVEENSWSVGKMAVFAAAICLIFNIRALYCGFSPMDDHIYVRTNMAIRSLDSNLLRWAFITLPVDFWQPLTWISLAIDYRIWGLNPFGYHLTNILLHAMNCALVVLIADRLLKDVTANLCNADRPKALYPLTLLLAGLLFGIHPLRVESVVWITERKDVLSGLFFLSSVFFYLEYVRRGKKGFSALLGKYYLLAFGAFLLALMVKPVSVVLPLMLLVLDWYPLERLGGKERLQVLMEKIPFLLFSVGISVLTLYIGANNHILRPYGFLSIGERLTVSGNALFEYCRLLILPLGISPFQLLTLPLPLLWSFKAAAVVIACIVSYAAVKSRWLLTVWLCFLLPLLPVLAIFQNGDQALAARYTYLPSIAICIAGAVMFSNVYVRFVDKGAIFYSKSLVAGIVAYLLFYAGMTFYLTKVWDNGETYWSRVIAMQPIAKHFFERAENHARNGRFAAAIIDYNSALEKATGDLQRYRYNIYALRGETYRLLGQNAEAVRDLTTAIRLSPHRIYYHSRGLALKASGRLAEAAEDFRIAEGEKGNIDSWYQDPGLAEIEQRLKNNPADAGALYQRGLTWLRSREYDRALVDFTRAISLQPSRPEYYWSRSTAYAENGDNDGALSDCNELLRLDPGHADAYLRRASIFADKGDYVNSLANLDSLLRLDPENYAGYANRGLLLYHRGETAAAIRDFNTALRFNPTSAPTYYNRGLAEASLGAYSEAQADLVKARELGYPIADDLVQSLSRGKQ